MRVAGTMSRQKYDNGPGLQSFTPRLLHLPNYFLLRHSLSI